MEIESDFSVLHRVDDLSRLPSSRYFDFAELLPSYAGAVRLALSRLIEPSQAAATTVMDDEPVDSVSPATLAALSNHPGFPGIEYSGG